MSYIKTNTIAEVRGLNRNRNHHQIENEIILTTPNFLRTAPIYLAVINPSSSTIVNLFLVPPLYPKV